MELSNHKPKNKKKHLESNFLYFLQKKFSSHFRLTADQVVKQRIPDTPG